MIGEHIKLLHICNAYQKSEENDKKYYMSYRDLSKGSKSEIFLKRNKKPKSCVSHLPPKTNPLNTQPLFVHPNQLQS